MAARGEATLVATGSLSSKSPQIGSRQFGSWVATDLWLWGVVSARFGKYIVEGHSISEDHIENQRKISWYTPSANRSRLEVPLQHWGHARLVCRFPSANINSQTIAFSQEYTGVLSKNACNTGETHHQQVLFCVAKIGNVSSGQLLEQVNLHNAVPMCYNLLEFKFQASIHCGQGGKSISSKRKGQRKPWRIIELDPNVSQSLEMQVLLESPSWKTIPSLLSA